MHWGLKLQGFTQPRMILQATPMSLTARHFEPLTAPRAADILKPTKTLGSRSQTHSFASWASSDSPLPSMTAGGPFQILARRGSSLMSHLSHFDLTVLFSILDCPSIVPVQSTKCNQQAIRSALDVNAILLPMYMVLIFNVFLCIPSGLAVVCHGEETVTCVERFCPEMTSKRRPLGCNISRSIGLVNVDLALSLTLSS